jgi:hypothetical protein
MPSPRHTEIYTLAELRILRSFRRPIDIQRFRDEKVAYNKEPGGVTCYSPRTVMKLRLAHCMEGATFAAAALEFLGHAPRIVDLTATRDSDHVLAVFQQSGRWGAIAKSNFSGLRYREPVYWNVRELAMSYFENYFNLRRERTLRGYSIPVSLRRFDGTGWRTTTEPIWEIPIHLTEIEHLNLISPAQKLTRVDGRTFQAGLVGSVST